MCIVLKTHVLRGCCEIFNIKVCFQNSCSIPTEQTLSVCAERAVAPCAANSFNGACCWRHRCLLVWYYHLPAVLNFIWIEMKRSGKGVHWQTYLNPSFFPPPHSNFRHAKWLDIVFYTSTLPCALWDLHWKRERGSRISPRIRMQRAEDINQSYLTHRIFVDMTRSCQMFWIVQEWID